MKTEKCLFMGYLLTAIWRLYFHPAKFDNFKDEKMSDYKTVSVAQSKNLLDWKPASLINYELLLRTVLKVFWGNFFFFNFALQNIKKLHSKVAHNWLGLAVFSPASFCFVQLRQFYSLKFSHLWSCQTLQDEKIA